MRIELYRLTSPRNLNLTTSLTLSSSHSLTLSLTVSLSFSLPLSLSHTLTVSLSLSLSRSQPLSSPPKSAHLRVLQSQWHRLVSDNLPPKNWRDMKNAWANIYRQSHEPYRDLTLAPRLIRTKSYKVSSLELEQTKLHWLLRYEGKLVKPGSSEPRNFNIHRGSYPFLML